MRPLLKLGGIFSLVCVLGWLVLSRDVLHPSFEDMSMVPDKRDLLEDNIALTEQASSYWQLANLTEKDIPESVFLMKDVQISHEIKNIMFLDIFVRQALPPPSIVPSNQTILFLHGMNYQSKNWEELGFLKIMAGLGHRAVAIDLPGFGLSKGEKLEGKDRATFLADTIKFLSIQDPVLVSPSMSGQFAMPYLESYSKSLSGFVPVAPVGSSSISPSRLRVIKVPTIHVFGDNDPTGLATQARTALSVLPYYREFGVKGAGHSPYLEQPTLFNKILFNFLELIRLQPQPKTPITWRNWKTWKRQGLLSRM